MVRYQCKKCGTPQYQPEGTRECQFCDGKLELIAQLVNTSAGRGWDSEAAYASHRNARWGRQNDTQTR